jgi:molybdopterin converting factor small subunit
VQVEVQIPSILADCTGGRSVFFIDATTLADAVDRMRDTYPLLRIHLFDESGEIRQHVVLFYNGVSLRRIDSRDISLREGDTIVVLQAVSGG